MECVMFEAVHTIVTSQNEMEMFVSYESVFNAVYDQISV